ncbi:unnamed protein product [Ostreobium quekettii]|uniref:Uncharacterized protein n=1 Tax=Ostreobium quekettii TaxID=121088 RepID=A0A8S1IQH8_9CHLO|nr:unnamed protein product [Ostreobium quekettii]
MGKFLKTTAMEMGAILRPTYQMLLPERTRDGLEALWREARSDVPKDLAFLQKHALALKPQTMLGWLVGLCILATLFAVELAALCFGCICIGAAVMSAAIAMFAVGAFLSMVLIPTAFTLFAGVCFWGAVAFAFGYGACVLALTSIVVRYIKNLFEGMWSLVNSSDSNGKVLAFTASDKGD